ncbi:MAG TPA: hypothetical protein VMD77_10650 [Candidatus Baltobacteraceae bacterium]|nr:hypothetical protein [Candidatus Baltobacteraceae bacterium]
MTRQPWKHFGPFIVLALASALFIPITTAQTFTQATPTAADWAAIAKLPDFTGVWEEPLGGGSGSLILEPGASQQNLSGPPKTAATSKFPTFPRPPGLPLTPEWAAKVAALKAHAAEDNTTANCLPPGMPEIMGQPYPYEFLLTPGQVTIVGEAYMIVRHIYTDGRPLPTDPDPTFFGTSIGHWEGNTLVVESVGFSPLTTIDSITPHSDKMRILERFQLVDPNTMSIETTVIDPIALTHPYTTTRILKRHRNWTIDEYICEENNRNSVTRNGKAEVDITPPPPPEPDSK